MITPYKADLKKIHEDDIPHIEILKALEIISTQIFEIGNAYVKMSEYALQTMKANCLHKGEWTRQ